MKKCLLFLLITALAIFTLSAQQNDMSHANNGQVTNGEITIQKNTDFQTALKIIEHLSLSEEKKNIVNISNYRGGVPFQINRIGWKDALTLLVKALGLTIEERPGAYIISDISAADASLEKGAVDDYNVHDKMIRITATFLHVDKQFMNDMGINWSTLFRGQVQGNVGFSSTSTITDRPNININTTAPLPTGWKPDGWQWGKTNISLDILFNYIEENQKGSILARPTITVLNGQEGYIQVGEDISIKQTDEQGNTTDNFFNTGIILNVRPIIIEEDGFEVIYLESSVEKSSFSASSNSLTTRIAKNTASSHVMLFDGEETVIGGLIDTETHYTRGGVPLLKDLPWWFFGLRYLFGYSSRTNLTREMIVIMKVDIVDPAQLRLQRLQEIEDRRDINRDQLNEMRQEFQEKKEDFYPKF
jgi:type IV pilus assembly protein PilQ